MYYVVQVEATELNPEVFYAGLRYAVVRASDQYIICVCYEHMDAIQIAEALTK